MAKNMLIGGLEKCSLIDYPGKISAIVFTQGCNFRCGYCHNPELVYPSLFQKPIAESKALEFLKKRIGKLEAVVITGGEPTFQNDLPEFMASVKKLGFLVKLDTNGSNPELLENILKRKLANYLAMDIKAPIKKYQSVICAFISPERIKKSIGLIMGSGIDYEFRTTVVKSQLTMSDFNKIGLLIKGARLYALQKFVAPPYYKINSLSFLKEETYTDGQFEKIKKIMEKYIKECIIR